MNTIPKFDPSLETEIRSVIRKKAPRGRDEELRLMKAVGLALLRDTLDPELHQHVERAVAFSESESGTDFKRRMQAAGIKDYD